MLPTGQLVATPLSRCNPLPLRNTHWARRSTVSSRRPKQEPGQYRRRSYISQRSSSYQCIYSCFIIMLTSVLIPLLVSKDNPSETFVEGYTAPHSGCERRESSPEGNNSSGHYPFRNDCENPGELYWSSEPFIILSEHCGCAFKMETEHHREDSQTF